MPIFLFKCETCDQEFEFAKYKSDDTAQCPQCGENEPKRLTKKPSVGSRVKSNEPYYQSYGGIKHKK